MGNREDNPSLNLLEPISVRVVERNETRIGDQTEMTLQVESVGRNNVKHVSDHLARIVETETYINRIGITLIRKFASKNDATSVESEVMVTIYDCAKGEIEGDFRWTTIERTVVSAAGIQKLGPRRMKLPLKDPMAGRTDQEFAEEISKIAKEMKF
jgi:hypothetical protein